ncbi:dTDP-4-dehydrorhamnose 3,5-epimerase [Pseudonocardia sp. TMWB2A]|uniref:dTDP-4-dehydrorhamnose 3,5-epimerase n=1 Tax=Pseudonocardia sp. TMWB2A TaxID=687430 RepID=UPI00307D5E7C
MTVLHIVPKRFTDERGWFSETWSHRSQALPQVNFVQDNQSLSVKTGTLRGLHYQKEPSAQCKLVRCVRGAIFDVAVDVRPQSPTFGQWVGATLTAERGNQLFIPRGYAHGFMTLEEDCEVFYKVDGFYDPQCDAGIIWNDSQIGIAWPKIDIDPILSEKDYMLPLLADAELNFDYDGNPLRPLEN